MCSVGIYSSGHTKRSGYSGLLVPDLDWYAAKLLVSELVSDAGLENYRAIRSRDNVFNRSIPLSVMSTISSIIIEPIP